MCEMIYHLDLFFTSTSLSLVSFLSLTLGFFFSPPIEAGDASKKKLHLAFSLISGSSSFSLIFGLILIFHSSLFFLEFDLNFVWTNFDFSFFSVFARFFWTGFSNAISLIGINDFRLLILIALTLPIC